MPWFRPSSEEGTDTPAELRRAMVAEQIAERGVRDSRVLAAMETVPRHLFVPDASAREAYADYPLPIGQGQTISQPYIVAYMVEALGLDPGARVLEVGTGCGYQAAVLAVAGFEVFSVEIRPALAAEATARLQALGWAGVHVRCGDGYEGWREEAPFDGIVVSAAPPEVPAALLEQLAPGGALVVPVGCEVQELRRYRRAADGFTREDLLPVRFVPMIHGGRSVPREHAGG